jgi:hypothetical protein
MLAAGLAALLSPQLRRYRGAAPPHAIAEPAGTRVTPVPLESQGMPR